MFFVVRDCFWLYFIRLQCLNVIIIFFKQKFSLPINQKAVFLEVTDPAHPPSAKKKTR
jgi:hypothetical protein